MLPAIKPKMAPKMDDKKIISSISKIAGASFAAGVAIQATKYLVAAFIDLDRFVDVLAQLALSGAVGVGIFLAICYALKLDEFILFKSSLSRKLFKGKLAAIAESTEEVSGI